MSFDVTGDHPVIVDMPTLWVHNITNTGASELTALFWAHPLFDPDAPDTFAETVLPVSTTQHPDVPERALISHRRPIGGGVRTC